MSRGVGAAAQILEHLLGGFAAAQGRDHGERQLELPPGPLCGDLVVQDAEQPPGNDVIVRRVRRVDEPAWPFFRELREDLARIRGRDRPGRVGALR